MKYSVPYSMDGGGSSGSRVGPWRVAVPVRFAEASTKLVSELREEASLFLKLTGMCHEGIIEVPSSVPYSRVSGGSSGSCAGADGLRSRRSPHYTPSSRTSPRRLDCARPPKSHANPSPPPSPSHHYLMPHASLPKHVDLCMVFRWSSGTTGQSAAVSP